MGPAATRTPESGRSPEYTVKEGEKKASGKSAAHGPEARGDRADKPAASNDGARTKPDEGSVGSFSAPAAKAGNSAGLGSKPTPPSSASGGGINFGGDITFSDDFNSDLELDTFSAPAFDGASALADVLAEKKPGPGGSASAVDSLFVASPLPADFGYGDKPREKGFPFGNAASASDTRSPDAKPAAAPSPFDGTDDAPKASGGESNGAEAKPDSPTDIFSQPIVFDKTDVGEEAPSDGGFGQGDGGKPSAEPYFTGGISREFILNSSNHSEGADLFKVAEELRNAVIVKNFSRAFTENNLMREGQSTALRVEGVSSVYYVSEGGAPALPMCEDLSFSLKAGSCCALVSDIKITAYAVAREIAERCENPNDTSVTAGEDPEHRREVLYIGSDSCLPPELSCLEFMMYTQSAVSEDDGEQGETRKKRLGIMLSQLGLSDTESIPLKDVPYNKRIMIIAAAAAINPHIGCVIINDPHFDVGPQDDMLARRVFTLLSNRGKCTILSCCSNHLISSVANRVAVLKGGSLVFFGSYKSFIDQNCRRLLSFPCRNVDEVSRAIENEFPSVSASASGGLVCLSQRPNEDTVDFEQLLNELTSQGVEPGSIVLEEKNFDIALKEVLSR